MDSANARNAAYTGASKFAVTQTDLQDTQLTSLSSLAATLRKAVTDAVANNDATSLMNQAQSIFDQATAILNSKDSNGDYIYSGGKTDVAPMTVSSLSSLAALPSVSETRPALSFSEAQPITPSARNAWISASG